MIKEIKSKKKNSKSKNKKYKESKSKKKMPDTSISYQAQFNKIIKSFCGGSRGAVFSKRAPLAAGGNYD
jgi:hypothetical protein